MKLGNIMRKKTKKEKAWTLEQEEKSLESNLKSMSVSDEQYKATLDAIEQVNKTTNAKRESRVKRAKDIGTLVLCGLVAVAAYGIDKSDKIQTNKCSANLFGKIFRL